MRLRLIWIPLVALVAAACSSSPTAPSHGSATGSTVQAITVDGSSLPPLFEAPSPNSCPMDKPRTVTVKEGPGKRLDVDWNFNDKAEKTLVRLYRYEATNTYVLLSAKNVDAAEGKKYAGFYPGAGKYRADVTYQVCGVETKVTSGFGSVDGPKAEAAPACVPGVVEQPTCSPLG